ncbi:MAG TPA: hypothetical protein VK021_13860 [Flavobacteriaceae bacterium]|nr:hypothetical protein [Flavobacteriaceae bacterium]
MTTKKLFQVYPPLVMSIEPVGNKYQIRVLFSSSTQNPKYAGSKVWGIQKLNATKENKKWVLENLMVELTKKWSSKRMGLIKYSYPPNHKFNQQKALKAENFCNNFIERFNPSYNTPFRFYVTDNVDEMGLLENFDYYFAGITTGKSRENMIFSALGNEYYPHEFVHQLLPENKNRSYLIEEGLAMYLGTKKKKLDYDQLLNKLAFDLSENPDKINFKSVCSQKVRFNGYQTAYPAGAAICEVVYNEKSDNGLLKLMEADTKNYAALVNSVCEITGFTEKEFKEHWHNVIKTYR